jgi:hypothetical protein
MKKDNHAFILLDPRIRRKVRHMYQNLSLAKKIECRRSMAKTVDSLRNEFPRIYREDGSIDIFEVAKRSRWGRGEL